MPSGVVAGDQMFAVCCGAATWNVPSGWTSVASQTSGNIYLHVMRKEAGGSESPTTFSMTSSAYGYVVVSRWTGVSSASPINSSATAQTTLTAPAVTTSLDECSLLFAIGSATASGSFGQPTGSSSIDLPSNSFVGTGVAWLPTTDAGLYSGLNWTDAGSTTDQAVITVAINQSVVNVITTLETVDAEIDIVLPIHPHYTQLDEVDCEVDIQDVVMQFLYTTVATIDVELSIEQVEPGPLLTLVDEIDAEIELPAMPNAPFMTSVDAIGLDADLNVALPGPLLTSLASIDAVAHVFRPFMQALSDVYRVYIANQALTANIGTASQFVLNERTTSPYTGQLVDEDGDSITKSVLDACQLVVYDKRTRTVIRETRDAFDDIATNGTISWQITPFETSIVSSVIPLGQNEPHVATFEFAWDSEDSADYSLTFATTLDSKTVTVTHAMHGLAAEDYVVFKDAPAVGGLEMDGVFVVGTVADANTYTVTHVKAATAAASGSGTVTVYRRPRVSKHQFEFQVKKAEVE